MKSCSNITALAKELGLSRSAPYKWKWQMEAQEGSLPMRTLQKKIHKLTKIVSLEGFTPVDVDADVLVHVDDFAKYPQRGVKHTPENVKLFTGRAGGSPRQN